jgi:hypothetical protein
MIRFILRFTVVMMLLAAVGGLLAWVGFRKSVQLSEAPSARNVALLQSDIPIHYVGVGRALDGKSIDVRFGSIEEPFILVLSSAKAVDWKFRTPPPRNLKAIVMYSAESDATVRGVFRWTPVFAIEKNTVRGFLINELELICIPARSTCSRSSPFAIERFDAANAAVETIFGRKMKRFSGAEAPPAIMLPGIELTTELLGELRRRLRLSIEKSERETVDRDRESQYKERYAAERQSHISSLLAGYPSFDHTDLAGKIDRIDIVSVSMSVGQKNLPKKQDIYLDYDSYKKEKLGFLGPVSIDFAHDKRTLLILLSRRPVVWRISGDGARLAGVLISSSAVSDFEVAPPSTPIIVTSHNGGGAPYFPPLNRNREEQSAIFKELKRLYPDTPISYHVFRAADTIVIR